MAHGTIWGTRKQRGSGHGQRNHFHASGNGLVAEYYAGFHSGWHPPKIAADVGTRELRFKKLRREKRKQ